MVCFQNSPSFKNRLIKEKKIPRIYKNIVPQIMVLKGSVKEVGYV